MNLTNATTPTPDELREQLRRAEELLDIHEARLERLRAEQQELRTTPNDAFGFVQARRIAVGGDVGTAAIAVEGARQRVVELRYRLGVVV